MGENFRTKTTKAYSHFLQSQATKLDSGLLFASDEVVAFRYPCHLYDDAPAISIGENLAIMLRSQRSAPGLMKGVLAIGWVEGDAAVSLRRRFKEQDVWPGVIDVIVTAIYPTRKMCEVSPLLGERS